MSAKSFEIGNLADDLVFVTLEICGKSEDKNPRFPRLFYPTFVDRIIKDALDIHEKVFEANERLRDDGRESAQRDAECKCVALNHLIRVAFERGYISEKQRDRWQKLVTALRFSIRRWIESDTKRKTTGNG